MSTNHQMNYYDYGKTLNAEGVMTALIGGGVNPDTHEYVDLGLPSKTLWATENIKDANGNELYFAWGETSGYTSGQVGTEKNFTWDDYEFGNPDSGTLVTDSIIDENNNLKPEYDASVVNWGNGWRMPTKAEFEELTANTEYEWTTVNDVQGVKFTSTVEGHTDKFLFFPAVGEARNSKVFNVWSCGNYWSASLYGVSKASELYFENGKYGHDPIDRCAGFSVRPVRSNS